MAKVNTGRVILGGLLAGLIIDVSESILNTVVLGQANDALMQARNLPPMDNRMIAWFMVLGFLPGIGTVWLYAAIRTRYGAGPATAIVAAVGVWFLAYLYPSAFLVVMGMFPAGLTALALLWGLAEIILASVAGAWLYSE